MEALSRSFRALGDATRLRLLRLLARSPLNVTELVSLVGVAQPSVSHHLAKLRELGLISEERQAGFTYYSLGVTEGEALWPILRVALDQGADDSGDLARLADLLRQREDRQALNDRLLEPGQSFQLWSRALGTLLPAIDVVDLGCGSGALTVEVARWARSVLAIDKAEPSLRAARERAGREGVDNVHFLCADLCEVDPRTLKAARRRAGRAPPSSYQLAVASQSLHFADDPARFVRAARGLLAPGGRLVVLELLPHREGWVQERLGHRHLGFLPEELTALLKREGFKSVLTELPAQHAPLPFRPFFLTGVKS